jgi:hypothetical protein
MKHPTQPVAWIVVLPIAHRSVFGITEAMHQLRSRKYSGKLGECFLDVAARQRSLKLFAWNFLRGIFRRSPQAI